MERTGKSPFKSVPVRCKNYLHFLLLCRQFEHAGKGLKAACFAHFQISAL